jgi:hypothetical protein
MTPPDAVRDGYRWSDRSITFHRCAALRDAWVGGGSDGRAHGVIARLLAPDVPACTRIRHLDGAGTDDYVD